jgi:hypothetical protein
MSDLPHARLFAKLEADDFDAAGLRRSPFSVVGALIRAPGALVRDLKNGRSLGALLASLAFTTLLFSAAYGAILGLYRPGLQTAYAAAKLPIVVLGTALLCAPTFYVFNAILGSRFSFGQTLVAVLFLSAAAALVLVAFAPIAWFFTVSTRGAGFIVVLHSVFFAVAAGYGIRWLNTARKYLGYLDETQTAIHGGFLASWCVLVLFVACQMAWTFRPLLLPGPEGPVFHTGERGLFFEALEQMWTWERL